MFKRFYNSALLTGKLEPDGPLLIVKGGYSPDPSAPDMAFVRTMHGGSPTVYLPGSSLKGVLRAHAERIVATEAGVAAAESPLDHRAPRRRAAAASRSRSDTAAVYRGSCETDRMFGSTELAGRCRVEDAYPVEGDRAAANATDVRFGVAIDRTKQSVRVGLFESDAVVGGRFALRVGLENFDLWMLALLVQVLDDVEQGFVLIGHSKSRGFGTVHVRDPVLLVRQLRGASGLRGAGAIERDDQVRAAYGLDVADSVPAPEGAVVRSAGLFDEQEWSGWDSIRRVSDAIVAARWTPFVEAGRAASRAGHAAGGPPGARHHG